MNKLLNWLLGPFIRLRDDRREKRRVRELNKKWELALACELAKFEGEGADYQWYKPLVENQYKTARVGSVQVQKDSMNSFLMFRIGCAAARNLIGIRSIASLQPMTAPTALVYYLAFTNTNVDALLKLEVLKSPVVADARKLDTKWSMEAFQDMQLFLPSPQAEDEFIAIVGQEVAEELIRSLIQQLRSDPLEFATFETIDHLILGIQRAANEIAKKTRRGPGNFVIVPPALATNLLMALTEGSTSKYYKPVEIPHLPQLSSLLHVGTALNSVEVFSSTELVDEMIIGYAGAGVDSGVIVSPYVMVNDMGTAIDPATFSQMRRISSRSSVHVVGTDPTVQTITSGDDYYMTVKIPEALLTNPFEPEPQPAVDPVSS